MIVSDHRGRCPRMSRKKPAPDVIRRGNRFSDKDMRKI
jgi:hypothetical protein